MDRLTRDEIKNLANHGFKVDERPGSVTQIGVKHPQKHTWHWFVQYTAGGHLFFDHSYSQLKGVSQRGAVHEIRIVGMVKKWVKQAKTQKQKEAVV